MKKNIKLIFGVVIVVVIITGAYFMMGSDIPITGAFAGTKECVSSDAKAFHNACSSWKDNGYEDKPATLKVMTDTSARQMCDKLLGEYKVC